MKQLFFVILFLSLKIAFSQSLSYRQKVEKGFFVLKNEHNFLPIKNLASAIFEIKSLNETANIFYKSALRYTENLDTLNSLKYNTLIIIVSADSLNLLNKYIDTIAAYNSVIFIFDNQDITSVKSEKWFSAAQSVYADSLAFDYAAQLCFGAFSAYGNDTIKGGIRFKYTIPQELGLDSAFLYNKIDSIVNRGMELQAFPGCVIFVALKQKVIFYRSYGFHTYERITPVNKYDLYDLASITKIAASAPCLMLLNQEGKFSLSDKISKYYRPWRHSNKKNITFIDALTHQARLKPWIPFWKKLLYNRKGRLKKRAISHSYSHKYSVKIAENFYLNRHYVRKVYKLIKKSPLLPEKKYKYSDLSFYIYPLIIKKLYGKDIFSCLKENFYLSLGAYSLMFNPWRKYDCKKIVPTENDTVFRHQLLCGYVHDEGAAMLGGVSGHAGLFGNANDLAKLMQMFLNYGEYGGKRYLSELLVRRWTRYQFIKNGNRRGIAFDKPLLKHKELGTPSPLATNDSFGHSGFTGTFVWMDPEYKLLFVFLSNRVYPSRDHKNLLRYNIRPSIHTVIYQAIIKRNRGE